MKGIGRILSIGLCLGSLCLMTNCASTSGTIDLDNIISSSETNTLAEMPKDLIQEYTINDQGYIVVGGKTEEDIHSDLERFDNVLGEINSETSRIKTAKYENIDNKLYDLNSNQDRLNNLINEIDKDILIIRSIY